MRYLMRVAFAAALFVPAAAYAAIPCADLPKADQYVHEKLRPGPNTRAAVRYLDRARHARSEKACSAALTRVDYYAKRSAEADRRAATK